MGQIKEKKILKKLKSGNRIAGKNRGLRRNKRRELNEINANIAWKEKEGGVKCNVRIVAKGFMENSKMEMDDCNFPATCSGKIVSVT